MVTFSGLRDANFNFDVKYIKGTSNVGENYLSRID